MLTAQPPSDELSGRVALVTGAARGQGLAIARRLHAAGARIIAGDILDEVADLEPELGDDVVAGRLDVREPASWAELVAQGTEVFGGLDILVNNAGILRRMSIERETPEAFANVWHVNCLGPFLGIQAALPHLRRSSAAAVVNTSSLAGVSAWTMHGSYVSSKWAIRGFTKVAALELAADRIRVNAVMPGPVATPMMLRDEDPDARDRLSRTPIGRIGEPEDVAEAVLFLVSDRSAFMTGSELVIDGGQHAGVISTAPELA